MVYKSLKYQGGAFTALVGSITLELLRDECAVDLLTKKETDLAFLGSDRLEEWTMAGTLGDVNVVDSVPIDCRMVLAGPANKVWGVPTKLGMGDLLTVATSYPNLLGSFAAVRGLNLAVTYTPSGGCEAYALRGRTDLVFDIKNTGDTLRDNDLVVYREGEQLSLNVLDKAETANRTRDRLSVALERIASTYLDYWRVKKDDPAVQSYTLDLIRDPNELVKKFSSEFGELMEVLLRKPANKQKIIAESADFVYALGVWLAKNGLSMSDVLNEDVRRNRGTDNE